MAVQAGGNDGQQLRKMARKKHRTKQVLHRDTVSGGYPPRDRQGGDRRYPRCRVGNARLHMRADQI